MAWDRSLRPPPRLTVSEWADRNRTLSREGSAQPGRWVTATAEYQRGIMDALSDPTVETAVVMTAAQVGKTEMINNVVGYHIDQDPAPILVVMPTLEMADAWSKDRFAPMLRDTAALRGRVADSRSRDSGNTIRHKSFAGGRLTASGANSPSSLASRPIRVVLLDEVDLYPASAGSEGDPVSLARKRATTYWNKKIVMTSTPSIKGESKIEAAYLASDQRRFHVPCPDCGEAQILSWAHVHWDKTEADEPLPETAVYACEHCGSAWDDAMRNEAVSKGEWRAGADFNGTAGFHLNELYSPWVPLSEMVTAWLAAQNRPDKLQAFINGSLGETWEDRGEVVDDADYAGRGEDYDALTLPIDVLAITAGVDVQDDRLEAEFVGWGQHGESWSISYETLWGDPSTPDLWERLDELLRQPFLRTDGLEMKLLAAAVDSGGHYTQAVYDFVKGKAKRRIFAVKGRPGAQPIWPQRPSRNNKGRIPLMLVGVDTAKEQFYARLRVREPGPGYCHFPVGEAYDETYFQGLTAEKRVTRYRGNRRVHAWQPRASGRRNEPLDCRIYATAAYAGLKFPPDYADILRRKAEAATSSAKPEPPPPWKPSRAPARRGNWVADGGPIHFGRRMNG